jgi:hypothetical protein
MKSKKWNDKKEIHKKRTENQSQQERRKKSSCILKHERRARSWSAACCLAVRPRVSIAAKISLKDSPSDHEIKQDAKKCVKQPKKTNKWKKKEEKKIKKVSEWKKRNTCKSMKTTPSGKARRAYTQLELQKAPQSKRQDHQALLASHASY